MKKSNLLFVVCAAVLCSLASAQVPVSLAPLSGPFLYTNGPNTGGALAFGCVFTYMSGTSTPLATYTDGSGTTQNANPVVLNAGGYASIWFTSGQTYGIKVVSSGGINCASGSTQYTQSQINQSLLNLSNTWQQTQYFLDPIYLEPADLQIVFGWPSGTQTTLDIPPTSNNVILHGPPLSGLSSDTLVSAAAVQTLSNKTLLSPTINGCTVENGPATYVCIANNSSTATLLFGLAVLTGVPSTATVAPITATNGIIGVVEAGAGSSGTATIQENGVAICTFDGGYTANDYVQASSTVAGNCHDAGPYLPTSGQVLGTILASSGVGGYAQINLNPAGSGGGVSQKYVALGGSTSANGQILQTLTIPAGVLTTNSYVTVSPAITGTSGTGYNYALDGTATASFVWNDYGTPQVSILMLSNTSAYIYLLAGGLGGPAVQLISQTITVSDVTANPLVITLQQNGAGALTGQFAVALAYP